MNLSPVLALIGGDAQPALVEGPSIRTALIFLAGALVLVPAAVRWAEFVLGPRAASDVRRAPWGLHELALVLGCALTVVVFVALLPGLSTLAILLKTAFLLASIGAAILWIVRRTAPGAVRVMGFAPGGNVRGALFGASAYALLLPAMYGVFGLWPLVAEAIGLELEDQKVLVDILALEGGELQLAAVLAVLVVPFFEEVVFRGFLQPVLARWIGLAPGVVLTAIAFAALHGVSASGPIFVVALALGWIQIRSGRLTAAWAAHAVHNGAILAYMFASR